MWAFGLILSSLPGLGIAQVKAFIFIACRAHDFFFMAVGLRAIDLAILLHSGYYSFVFPLMGLLAIILPCQPVLPLYSLGFLGPFTYSLPLFTSLGLLLHSLGIIGLFIFSLPLVIFMGLLAINPATPAHWACFLISLPFCPLFSSYLFYCWAFSAVRPFVKMGISNMYNACENSKKKLYIIVHIYLIN